MSAQELVHDTGCVNFVDVEPISSGGGGQKDAIIGHSSAQVEADGKTQLLDIHLFGTCQQCVDAQFQAIMGRIQCQLHHLAGHDAEAVARAANHRQGPKAKWVNVGIEVASVRCSSTVP